MTPRSGVSIRRLIHPKKDEVPYEVQAQDFQEVNHIRPVSTFSTFEDDKVSSSDMNTTKRQRALSWMPSRQTKKLPAPIILVRRSEDIERVRKGVPSLVGTARSTDSSLCSCELNETDLSHSHTPPAPFNNAFLPANGLDSAGLCPPVAPPKACDATSNSWGNTSGHRRTSSAFSALDPHQNATQFLPTPPNSAKTSLEINTSPMLTPLEPGAHMHDRSMPHGYHTPPPDAMAETNSPAFIAPDLARFSQEADEAFKWASPKLTQTTVISHGTSDQLAVSIPPSVSLAVYNPTPALTRRKSRKGSTRSAKPAFKSPILPSKPPSRTPSRSSSTSKPRRTAKKAGGRPQARVPKLNASRWTLTGNARDLFNNNIFHRIEADEMLPESKLEEIRARARSNSRSIPALLRPKQSSAELRQPSAPESTCVTPEEPFHLEGLPSRIGAAGVDSNMLFESAIPPALNIPSSRDHAAGSEVIRTATDRQPGTITRPDTIGTESVTESPPIPPKDQSFSPPLPPPKNPARTRPRRGTQSSDKQLPPLPTIPEVVVTSPENLVLSPTSQAKPASTDKFIYLRSTNYTMACPGFKQGPVRLDKQDLSIEALTAAIDETLDWTAFQMAIIGGAGDFDGESTDYSRLSDAELNELDDLADWFDGWGFTSRGGLIGYEEAAAAASFFFSEDVSTPRTSSSRYSTDSIGTTYTIDSEGSMRTQHRPRTTATGFMQPATPLANAQSPPVSMQKRTARDSATVNATTRRPNDVRWGGAHFRQASYEEGGDVLSTAKARRLHKSSQLSLQPADADGVRRPSVGSAKSLPQSPMLELVVSKDVEGNEYVVPMGFNLGHDLGDYLQWETTHVFAGGYLG